MMANYEQYFNSTMVRLKALWMVMRIPEGKFQFHYGTIKRIPTACTRTGLHYFNSTMVRLKGFCFHDSFDIFLFQFHYGTIKRLVS